MCELFSCNIIQDTLPQTIINPFTIIKRLKIKSNRCKNLIIVVLQGNCVRCFLK